MIKTGIYRVVFREEIMRKPDTIHGVVHVSTEGGSLKFLGKDQHDRWEVLAIYAPDTWERTELVRPS